MRKLASIQKIKEISPIKGYDRVELATVLGYKSVIKKGDFKVGDICVYFEVDSVLPKNPEYEFLRLTSGYRIRMAKICGVFSEGLIMRPEQLPQSEILKTMPEGADCTELLGIVKYLPKSLPRDVSKYADRIRALRKAPLIGALRDYFKQNMEGKFPTQYISKTDEDRFQTMPEKLKLLIGQEAVCTEKIDGFSATYLMMKREKRFPFQSRYVYFSGYRNKFDDPLDKTEIYHIYKTKNIKAKLKKLLKLVRQKMKNEPYHFIGVAIQGEIFGLGVQANPYRVENVRYNVFNLKPIFKEPQVRATLSYGDMAKLCQIIGLDCVPLLQKVKITEDFSDKMLKDVAARMSIYNNKTPIEGFVCRVEGQRNITTVPEVVESFKILNPIYLMKYQDANERQTMRSE
ncbi:MAG: hypothetical protein LBV16_04100 [Elusimicrobiota bacterium]|jgi:hypothetical protein|nr:hypothetical protein [Elusimicrobiota bacterium]